MVHKTTEFNLNSFEAVGFDFSEKRTFHVTLCMNFNGLDAEGLIGVVSFW